MKLPRQIFALLIGLAVLPVSSQTVVPDTLALLTAASTSGRLMQWVGGMGIFDCVGTWNGATVTFEFVGPDGITMVVAGTATTLTANGAGVFYLPRDTVQAAVSGAGGSTSLSCSAVIVRSVIQ